jgi:DNA polymerase III subunit gamma/tau
LKKIEVPLFQYTLQYTILYMQKYQVFARKYRPQTFQDVVGQEVVVTTLKNAIRMDKVAHAYLFCGGRGCGKTTLARLFAKALNCANLSHSQEPCNQCPSCLDIMAGQSLDVIEIDGASNRGIDDVRQINEMVGYVPTNGRYKIYIIDEVHMLTKEAFNALLKTLEEPPSQAKFFFATTEAHKILPTIISRCQRFDLGRISISQIHSKLDQIASDLSRDVDGEALHKIAELSDGSLRDAESLFDQLLCFQDGKVTADSVAQVFGLVSEEYFFKLDLAFSEYQLSFAFDLVNHLFQSGKDLSHFLSQLIDHYRLIAIAKTVGESALPSVCAARYMQTSKHYTQQQSLTLLEYLITSEGGMQKSLSPRIFLENVLLHIIRTKNRIPIEVIARRLSELEGNLPAAPEIPPIPFPTTKIELPMETPKMEVPAAKPKAETIIETPKPKQEMLFENSNIESEKRIETPKIEVAVVKPKAETIIETPKPKQEMLFENSNIESEKRIETPKIEVAVAKPKAETIIEIPAAQVESLKKHQSHYDTIMRFAAVELEGSLKT